MPLPSKMPNSASNEDRMLDGYGGTKRRKQDAAASVPQDAMDRLSRTLDGLTWDGPHGARWSKERNATNRTRDGFSFRPFSISV